MTLVKYFYLCTKIVSNINVCFYFTGSGNEELEEVIRDLWFAIRPLIKASSAFTDTAANEDCDVVLKYSANTLLLEILTNLIVKYLLIFLNIFFNKQKIEENKRK